MNKILAALAAIAGFIALFFRGQIHKERADREEAKADRIEAVKDQSEKATTAMIRGVEDENKPADRGYFDNQ